MHIIELLNYHYYSYYSYYYYLFIIIIIIIIEFINNMFIFYIENYFCLDYDQSVFT